MGKTFDLGAPVEVQKDPGGIWLAARYYRQPPDFKGWHWVQMEDGFLTKSLVPARRIRATKALP